MPNYIRKDTWEVEEPCCTSSGVRYVHILHICNHKARVSEGVKPGVVDITEGWWIEQFKEGSLNHLTHDIINPIQDKVYEPNMHMNDVAVEIIRSEGENK